MSLVVRRTVLAVAVLAVAWIVHALWNDDSRRIGRRLAQLQKLASKSPVETQLQGAAKAKKIADLFASEFELHAEGQNFSTSDRRDLMRAIIARRARTRTLAVVVGREQLFVEAGGTAATHYAFVEFIAEFGDLRGTESYPVRVEWVEDSGEWLIRKLEVLPEERR